MSINKSDVTWEGAVKSLIAAFEKSDDIMQAFRDVPPVPDKNGFVRVSVDAETLHDASCLFSKAAIIFAYLAKEHKDA